MPLIGFIMGLTQINKSKHGLRVVLVSIIAFIIWLAIISSAGTSSGGGYRTYRSTRGRSARRRSGLKHLLAGPLVLGLAHVTKNP